MSSEVEIQRLKKPQYVIYDTRKVHTLSPKPNPVCSRYSIEPLLRRPRFLGLGSESRSSSLPRFLFPPVDSDSSGTMLRWRPYVQSRCRTEQAQTTHLSTMSDRVPVVSSSIVDRVSHSISYPGRSPSSTLFSNNGRSLTRDLAPSSTRFILAFKDSLSVLRSSRSGMSFMHDLEIVARQSSISSLRISQRDARRTSTASSVVVVPGVSPVGRREEAREDARDLAEVRELLDLDFCAVLDGGVVALEGSGSEIIARERSGHSYRGDSVSLTGNVSITCWASP